MLPPFDWQPSRQRCVWLLLITAVALVSVVSSGLLWYGKLLLALLLVWFIKRQWPENGPERVQWRDSYLWLGERAYCVTALGRAYRPCWVLQLSDAISGQQRQLLLWPDSLAEDALRQLRVAVALSSAESA